jgi:predicted nucleotidyltransferase
MKIVTVTERKKILEDELKRILEILRDKYKPEKIVLFGSLANRELHEWSDIDLLIIKGTTKRPIERILEVSRLIEPKVGIDLFIYTPEEYELLLKERFSFLLKVLKTGKIVYEKRS